MAAACEAVTRLGRAARGAPPLVRAALGLVFAEAGLLCVRREGGIYAVAASTVGRASRRWSTAAAPSLVTSALFSGEPLTADGRIPWAPRRSASSCRAARWRRAGRRAAARAGARPRRPRAVRHRRARPARRAVRVAWRRSQLHAPSVLELRDDPAVPDDGRILIAEDETIIRLDLRATARGERLRGLRRGARRRRGGRARRARSSPT